MNQIPVRIDEPLYERLLDLKQQNGVPVAESVRRAVREYLAKFNNPIISKERVGLDALDSAGTLNQKPEAS